MLENLLARIYAKTSGFSSGGSLLSQTQERSHLEKSQQTAPHLALCEAQNPGGWNQIPFLKCAQGQHLGEPPVSLAFPPG